MFGRTLIIFLVFNTFSNDASKVDLAELIEKNRMIGIDTVHEHDNTPSSKIDKDTVITRNLKLEKKPRIKNAEHLKKEQAERDPDWSYSSFPPEMMSHVEYFKKNMSECLKEVQANDKRTVKKMSPGRDSPVHGDCLIACVLKRNGVIVNGKVRKANLLSLVRKFYAKDKQMMKKLDKNLDRCVELTAKGEDECSLARQLNDCTNDLMASNKHKIRVNY